MENQEVVRFEKRAFDALRPLRFQTNVNKYAEGSCLVETGDTRVLCTATLEERIPLWVRGTGKGWITAEYGMLPRSTNERMEREAKKGQSGRTHEIQRLIGRSYRSAVDLKKMGEVCIKLDCDVIQADGGTRTASVSGGFVALYEAFKTMMKKGIISSIPVTDTVCAVSCGIIRGVPMLDLDYEEDSSAWVDSNFVMTGSGRLVEIQGTAERNPFSAEEFLQLLSLARKGCAEITRAQKEVLKIG